MRNRKLLVCQHVPYEILGTLDPLLKEKGFRMRYVNFARHPEMKPDITRYRGLILLGGPMSAYDLDRFPYLATELELIQKAERHHIPVLGICLGSQLIAEALGGKAKKNHQKEIGWYNLKLTEEGKIDPTFQNFKKEQAIFQWHQDTFDLPPEAVHLAETPTCTNQAFRYGSSIYGFQFHLEVNESLIHRWLQLPHYQAQMNEDGFCPETIKEHTEHYISEVKDLSYHTFSYLVSSIFGPVTKTVFLPSQ